MSTRPLDQEPFPVMAALQAHLPLSLLVDLAMGPSLSSEEVLELEGEDAWWLSAPPSAPSPP